MSIKNKLISFCKSFYFAGCGIINCIKNERNMRFHFCAAFYVILFMRFYDLTGAEKAVVYLTIGLVISLELVNTAIEALTDKISPEKSSLAKLAKDSAAGAVLIAAAVSVAVAVCIFWDTAVFDRIYRYFSDNLLILLLLILSAIVWFFIIFLPDGNKKGKQDV